MFQEFKKFAIRGNMIDMAIGIIVGASFGTIVKSLVDDVIMPPIGLLLGKVDFANLFITLRSGQPAGPYQGLAEAQAAGAVTVNYGLFVNALVSFVIIAWVVFMIVKAVNRLKKAEAAAPSEPSLEQKLLTEIRDLLKVKNN